VSTAHPDTDDPAAFEAIVDLGTLWEFVATLTPVVNEGRLQLTDDDFRTVAVDPANVAMIDSTLPAAAFEHYERSGAIDVIGINLKRFDEILGVGDSDDVVELVLDAETRTLTVLTLVRLPQNHRVCMKRRLTAIPASCLRPQSHKGASVIFAKHHGVFQISLSYRRSFRIGEPTETTIRRTDTS